MVSPAKKNKLICFKNEDEDETKWNETKEEGKKRSRSTGSIWEIGIAVNSAKNYGKNDGD